MTEPCWWAWMVSTSSRWWRPRSVYGCGWSPRPGDGVPVVWRRRSEPRSARGRADRCAVVRPAGSGGVVETHVVVPRAGVPGRGVHRAGLRDRTPAGVVDGPGVLVGGPAVAPRARLRPGSGPPARHLVEDGVALDPATAGGDGLRPVPLRRRRDPRRRRTHLAPREHQGTRSEGTDGYGEPDP